MFEVKNKSAVIIGGGRGIGAAVSIALAEEGAIVTIIDADTVSNPINHYQSVNIDGYCKGRSNRVALGEAIV